MQLGRSAQPGETPGNPEGPSLGDQRPQLQLRNRKGEGHPHRKSTYIWWAGVPRRDVSNVRKIRDFGTMEGADGELGNMFLKPLDPEVTLYGGISHESGGLNNVLSCL